MSILTGVADFFGLDIGTTAVRLVQLRGNDPKALVKYASAPLDSKVSMSDSKADQQKVMQVVKELIDQSHIMTKNVALGIPSNKVFTAVVDIDRLNSSDLAKTIRYQADSLIPTPVAESKIDWALLGDSPSDKTKVEVLLSSVTNSYVEGRLDQLEAIGLNVIAIEPDGIALTRAVTAHDTAEPQMVLDIGSKATDLIVTMNGAPRLIRAIPTGSEAIIRSAMQNLNIDEAQAQQFVFKFGLAKEKLEGQVYHAIVSTIDLLTSEIEKSIKFYQARYTTSKIGRIIVTGGASSLPEFPLYLANKFAINVEIGNAWRNVSYPQARQNELLSVSNHFAVAAGLAERQA